MSQRRLLATFLILLCTACSSGDDETAELRALMDSAESAAEERQTGFFRSLLADSYSDAHGNNQERMIDTVRGYFLMHPSIEIVSRINSIELLGADVAEISMTAGVLGHRVGGSLLGGLDGRLYDLELELVRQGGDWQIIGAAWERALDVWEGGEIPESE